MLNFDSPVSPSASVPAALAFTSGPVSTSSLMSAVWLANDPATWPDSIAIPAIVDFFNVAVPFRSSNSVGPTLGTVSATAMSADPFSVVPASSLRSVNSDPGNCSNGPANFARISRAAIWKSTAADGKRAPARVESTSVAVVFSTRSSTVRPLPVNVKAPVSDPSRRSSSSQSISRGAAKRRGLSQATLPLAE